MTYDFMVKPTLKTQKKTSCQSRSGQYLLWMNNKRYKLLNYLPSIYTSVTTASHPQRGPKRLLVQIADVKTSVKSPDLKTRWKNIIIFNVIISLKDGSNRKTSPIRSWFRFSLHPILPKNWAIYHVFKFITQHTYSSAKRIQPYKLPQPTTHPTAPQPHTSLRGSEPPLDRPQKEESDDGSFAPTEKQRVGS